MSFSFTTRAPSIAEIGSAIAIKMDEIIAQQPGHKADRAAVLATVDIYSKLLTPNPEKDVVAHISGSLGGHYVDDGYASISGANVNVGLYQSARVD